MTIFLYTSGGTFQLDARSVDGVVADRLARTKDELDELRPIVSEHCYVETRGRIGAKFCLLVGTLSLYEFGYKQIREFSANVLDILANRAPETRHLTMTIHGPGYGLDEVEAFLGECGGFLATIATSTTYTFQHEIFYI